MHDRGRQLLLILCASALSQQACAIDRIIFRADEVTSSAGTGTGIEAILDLAGSGPKLELTGSEIRTGAMTHPFGSIRLRCERIVVSEPHFACESGELRARSSPVGPISMQAGAQYDSKTQTLEAGGVGLALAKGSLRFDIRSGENGWAANAHADALSLAGVRKLAAPWLTIPEDYTFDGRLGGDLKASGKGASTAATVAVNLTRLDLTNTDGTVVAETLDAQVDLKATMEGGDSTLDLKLTSGRGKALAGPVLLDLQANPLELSSSASLHGRTATIQHFALHQKDLLDAEGTAVASFGAKPAIESAHIGIDALQFPAAYTSLAQISLASTDFAALNVSGIATGSFDVAKNELSAIHLSTDRIDVAGQDAKFSFDNLRAALHWAADNSPPVENSSIAWTRGAAYGISGGAAQISFHMQGSNATLLAPVRVPVFDGAVLVNAFSIGKPGEDDMDLAFDAQIEPISMARLSNAFGWPQLSGQLSGSIPGLSYHNHELALHGDLEASVFDGTIVARNLRLQDPLGSWPRLFADLTARNLDLDLITHAFPIGSISGRVDAQIRGLELFNWSPIAFDAKIYTTDGDRSSHRISQRAVTSISGIGGGGGGVAAALQSGFLRFFDTFHYDRLGLSCQLRNDVCLMSGLEPTKTGYYIVKGGGLPRIDIIGNAGRVDWPTLLAQIEGGMHSQNIIVR